jgi:sarcosine oxidase/L-pipecolate oxidase
MPKVCVIGGGIIGSWTALHLAEAGAETTLLEQFPLPHTRGSSHGASRAFRFLGDETMDRLDYSLERWQALEQLVGERLFLRTGLLNFGPVGDPWLTRHLGILEDAGKPHDRLDAATIRSRFPTLSYPDEWEAAWDPNGGILFAHRCLAAVQARFRARGGTVLSGRAEALQEDEDGSVSVETSPGFDSPTASLMFDRVVVACGPWTSTLVPELRRTLSTTAIPVTYWRDDSGECSAAKGFPILYNARLTGIYALPSCEYPGLVKVLYHDGPEASPDARDVPDRQPYVDKVSAYVRKHLPALDHRAPAIEESCMYTLTPDDEPIIDRFCPGIVVGCGFSGSGFKHSPATGRMLASLALGEEGGLPEGYQLTKYALARFRAGDTG